MLQVLTLTKAVDDVADMWDFTPKTDMGKGKGFKPSTTTPHILKHHIPEHPNCSHGTQRRHRGRRRSIEDGWRWREMGCGGDSPGETML